MKRFKRLAIILAVGLSLLIIDMVVENTLPAVAKLVGRYVMTEDSKRLARSSHYPDAGTFIQLNADHSFEVRNMPDWWLDLGGDSHGRFDSGSGRWKLY